MEQKNGNELLKRPYGMLRVLFKWFRFKKIPNIYTWNYPESNEPAVYKNVTFHKNYLAVDYKSIKWLIIIIVFI